MAHPSLQTLTNPPKEVLASKVVLHLTTDLVSLTARDPFREAAIQLNNQTALPTSPGIETASDRLVIKAVFRSASENNHGSRLNLTQRPHPHPQLGLVKIP